MNLDYRAQSSLKVELLDPTTGLPGSESIGFNFGGFGTVLNSGIVCISWVPTTGKILTVDIASGLDVTSDGNSFNIDQLLSVVVGEVVYTAAATRFEIVLVADPLAVDAYGNPISASRASQLTVTTKNTAAVQNVGLLAVTTPGQAAILRRVSKLTGAGEINKIEITAVTATPCKLYLLFGGLATI